MMDVAAEQGLEIEPVCFTSSPGRSCGSGVRRRKEGIEHVF